LCRRVGNNDDKEENKGDEFFHGIH
jgi:hypothetical protein